MIITRDPGKYLMEYMSDNLNTAGGTGLFVDILPNL
jgi:hypothetical protein